MTDNDPRYRVEWYDLPVSPDDIPESADWPKVRPGADTPDLFARDRAELDRARRAVGVTRDGWERLPLVRALRARRRLS